MSVILAMGGCRCSYKNCKSATKTTENLHFFHYPVKHTERCRKWIENACKPQFFDLAEDQLRNKVVCELHFEERCFTNINRRRLLHDAIPTLDAGAEEEVTHVEYRPSVTQSDEIQVLPANEDGTLFTVDTDSFQQIPMSEKIESYIYNNGALVPLYKTEPVGVEESVVYTLEDTNMGRSEQRVPKSKNTVINTNTNVVFNGSEKNNFQSRTYKLLFNSLTDSEGTTSVAMDEDETSNGTSDNRSEQNRKNSNSGKVEEKATRIERNVLNTKMLKRVKQHSKDIALLKKTLKSTVIPNRQKYRKYALSSLAPVLPSTLFSLLKRNVKKGEVDVAQEELELYKEIYAASSSLYSSLKEKYGWNLPDPTTFCES